jgi:hypothetical protein
MNKLHALWFGALAIGACSQNDASKATSQTAPPSQTTSANHAADAETVFREDLQRRWIPA